MKEAIPIKVLMLCQKFQGFLYHKKTSLNSFGSNFSNLLFSGTFLKLVINITPDMYKIVENRVKINISESFLVIKVNAGIVIAGPMNTKKNKGFKIT